MSDIDKEVQELIDVCIEAVSEIKAHHLPHLPYEYTKHLDPEKLREILFKYQSLKIDMNRFAMHVAEHKPGLLWPAIEGYLNEGYYIHEGVLKERQPVEFSEP